MPPLQVGESGEAGPVLCLPSCCSGLLWAGERLGSTGGLGEGVSYLPAAPRAWAFPALLESIHLDHCLVCAHSEAEQVWGVPVLLPAALYPSPVAFSTTWVYSPLPGRGVEMSLPCRMHLVSEVLGYGVVVLVRRVLCKDVKPGALTPETVYF